jgi:D-alanyl-D-alanine carboxypeptidase (penicillin-binding protein 5/6)
VRRVLLGAPALVACCLPAALGAAPASALAPPSLTVRAATLVVDGTHQQLFGIHSNAELAIASATKLMTAMVTLQHVAHLDQVFTAPDYYAASSDSQIGLVPGDRMTAHDLMLAMMLPSADDAAEDLAYNVGNRSVARFVGMMNANARALGLTHTHYTTPVGLDTPGNYSSANNLVKLAGYMLGNRFFARIVAESSATLDTGPAHYVVNRNDLVAEYPWIKGVKTGHTSDAGYVLVAEGVRHGMTLLSAVLGTDSEASRDANTLALLDWGFRNFHLVTPVHAGEVVARAAVEGRPGDTVGVIAPETFSRALPTSARATVRLVVPQQLAGPLKRHAVVGYLVVHSGGRTLDRMPLLTARHLAARSPPTVAARFVARPSTLVLVLALLGLAAGLIVRRRSNARGGIQIR